MTAFESVVDKLMANGNKVRPMGEGRASAQCPAHDDKTPSLSVTRIEGSVLLHCHGGCDTDNVLDALGLNRRDLFDDSRGSRYDYADRSGTVIRTVSRTPDKVFRQSGNTKGQPTLYRLPQVVQAVAADRIVYLVEGEKDVHALEAIGLTATTAPMGADSFGKVDASPLYGAKVVAVVDKDAAGQKWAAAVHGKLDGMCQSLMFVQAADGKDAADHVAAGLGVDDFTPLDQEETPADLASWLPVDLSTYLDGTHKPAVPTLLVRTDGVCLLYQGLVHSLHGESESGKSLVAQYLAAQQIMAGNDVLFIDFESDAATVTERLLMFGATPQAIREHFHYIRPEVDPRAVTELPAWHAMLARSYVLAVIDGVTDSLGVFGYSTKDNDEVAAWMRVLPKNIANRTGAAVAVIDHVTKDNDSRGRFAIGAQAKMSGLTGAGYTVEVAEALGRGLRGVIVLRVGKDRPGHVRGQSGPMRKSDRTQEAARVVVDSTIDPDHPVVTVEPWRGSDGLGLEVRSFRLTGFMERISEALEVSTDPMSFRSIDTLVSGKQAHIVTALESLVTEGYVTRHDGPRNSKMHTSVEPYRQALDPQSDMFKGGETLNPPKRLSTVSRTYTGVRETDTQPSPGDSGETVGDSRKCGYCHTEPEPPGGGICSTCTDLLRPAS